MMADASSSDASSTSTQWPSHSSSHSTHDQDQTLHQQLLNRALNAVDSDPIRQAAHLLHSAEVLLLVTGAGFSADSGLATYLDVADIEAYRERGWRYRDLCRPVLHDLGETVNADHEVDTHAFHYQDTEMRHPQYFYGFWGQCINDYRKVRPHEGYEIIARWGRDKNTFDNTSPTAEHIRSITRQLQDKQKKQSPICSQEPYYVSPTERAGAFFFFTSNVDAHSYDVFHSYEIRECHGNTEVWQCANFECGTNHGHVGCEEEEDSSVEEEEGIGEDGVEKTLSTGWERRLWRLPLDHVFEVDSKTMSAPSTKSLQEETHIEKSLDDLPTGNLSKKRKSDADLTARHDDTNGEDVLNYLQNQFAAANEMDSITTTTPAHIGDVHGKPRLSHLKSMMHPTPSQEPNHYYLPISPTENWPRCPRCHELARPAVLMFDDLDWVYNSEQEKRWQCWYRAVLRLCQSRASGNDETSQDSDVSSVNESDVSNSGWQDVSEGGSECQPMLEESKPMPLEQDIPSHPPSTSPSQPLKVLILEIGCGYNVPTCRMISETLVKHLTDRGGDATLVRINPTHPEADDEEIEDRFIGIEEKGLHVLREMDVLYRQLRQGNDPDC